MVTGEARVIAFHSLKSTLWKQADRRRRLSTATLRAAGSRIRPHQNLCIIRSGQDWGETDEAERRMYFEDVEPFLTAGMRFLRDEGRAIGCYRTASSG